MARKYQTSNSTRIDAVPHKDKRKNIPTEDLVVRTSVAAVIGVGQVCPTYHCDRRRAGMPDLPLLSSGLRGSGD